MRIYEIILLEADQLPGIGQPVRSDTISKVGHDDDDIGRPDIRMFQIADKNSHQIYHKFQADNFFDAYDKAAEWLKKNLPNVYTSFNWAVNAIPPRMANKGAGAFKIARNDPTAPGYQVIKQEKRPGGDPGGTAWLNAIIEYNRTNPLGNPWLPVVTRISTKTDSKGQVRTQSSEMSLEDGANLSPEIILSFATRIFPNFESFVDHQSQGLDQKSYDTRFDNSFKLWRFFVDLIRKVFSDPESADSPTSFNYSEDDNMKEALQIVEKITTSSHYGLDIHTGNIMVRNTGRGWQPVLTDPLV